MGPLGAADFIAFGYDLDDSAAGNVDLTIACADRRGITAAQLHAAFPVLVRRFRLVHQRRPVRLHHTPQLTVSAPVQVGLLGEFSGIAGGDLSMPLPVHAIVADDQIEGTFFAFKVADGRVKSALVQTHLLGVGVVVVQAQNLGRGPVLPVPGPRQGLAALVRELHRAEDV